MSDSVAVIICYSRCLWCGRRTPHECCHERIQQGIAERRANRTEV
jgi:hypothetical protein